MGEQKRSMTASEIIDCLKQYPPDQEVFILDADTEWVLEIEFVGEGKRIPEALLGFDVEKDGSKIVIRGSYANY